MALFASLIEGGLFQVGRGDMFVTLTDRDIVHSQNLENFLKLAPYFEQQTRQQLVVCAYKRDGSRKKVFYQAQLRGGRYEFVEVKIKRGEKEPHAHIALVSVHTAKSKQKDSSIKSDFEKFIRANLGTEGRIVGVNIDEAHHIENAQRMHKKKINAILRDSNKTMRQRYAALKKENLGSWMDTWATLRSVSPNFVELTYTATPREKRSLAFFKYGLLQAIRDKVLPRPYVRKFSDGALTARELERVKTRKLKDAGEEEGDEAFVENSIVELLLSKPERNYAAFAQIEAAEFSSERLTPSGKTRPRSIAVFGRNLKHAHMIAQDYRQYCKQAGEGFLRKRNIVIIGKEDGTLGVTTKQYRAIKAAQQSGQAYTGETIPGVIQKGEVVDGIGVIVSGKTKPAELISEIKADMDAYQKGKPGPVEAVFGVDKIGEGFDLTEADILIDLDPGFSRHEKEQRLGRILRRNKKHINNNGTLNEDPPKLFIEPDDEREGLVHIGDFFFMNYDAMPEEINLDVLNGRMALQIDFEGDTNSVRT
ncbi:MAG: hypothetical protein KDK50_06880, partial [Chlamydiia bacterium]|nr:hypothetical protein [Chlamydiia bacterium]